MNTTGNTRRARRWSARSLLIAALVALALAALGAIALAAPSGNDPDSVSFTLEGCRQENLPAGYDIEGNGFLCDAGGADGYTTGNLGKEWNELDLVPWRVTTNAGNSAPATQTYDFHFVVDNLDAGAPGYDVITTPTLNAALSDASCELEFGAEGYLTPGVGGTDVSLYRLLTVTQDKNTTCVIDGQARLALGSHLYPGASLHFNLLNRDFATGGIGNKDVSIPVNEILPQELDKDMTATQDDTQVWNITKGATPASLSFGNSCSTDPADLSKPVAIEIVWTKTDVLPSGDVVVTTNVYATNPAARTITVNVTDVIYSGVTELDTANSGDWDVPANTTLLVLTHSTTVPAGTTDLNDVATATYTDKVTGVPIPGETEATASAVVQPSGVTLNDTATITDTESITGDNLEFSADSFAPAIGSFDGGYIAGTPTTGPVDWTSTTQSAGGSVEFAKTVYVTAPTDGSGTLSDTATLTGSDGFTANASASININVSALVDLTINKTITDGVLNGAETETFVFDIAGPDGYTDQVELIFGAGETSKSVTISGLEPGTYTVTEQAEDYWTTEAAKSVTLDPAANGYVDCAGAVSFHNEFAPSLTVTKTAAGTYDERHDWNVEKTVDPESQSAFAGDPVDWTWTIDVTETVVDQNFAVSGTIDVYNPMPYAATVSVGDVLDDGTAVSVDCDGFGGDSLTVPAGGTESCTYSAAPDDASATLNTATVSFFGTEFTGTAPVAFEVNVVNDDATVSDTEIGLTDEVVSGGDQFTADDGDVCSTDAADYGEDGMYEETISNTATLTDEEGTEYPSTADTTYTCYLWDVSKTAEGTFNDRYEWDITKTVSPASQSGFAGDTLSWTWTIDWSSSLVGEENHAVSGVITVTNPADKELTVDVADELTGGFAATVTCNDGDGGTDLTIPANSSGTCDYSAAPGSQLAQNEATATRGSVSVSATVDVNWTQLGDTGLDATVSDSSNVEIPLGPGTYTYTESDVCSELSTSYTDGSYSGSATNTATIMWDGGSDSSTAITNYDCYLWDVSKTAEGTWNNRYEWDITKTVNPASQSGFAGDTLSWTWTIDWSSSLVGEENHAVDGVITVYNPNPDSSLTVDVADELTGGFAANVDCDGSGGDSLTVAAATVNPDLSVTPESATCDYSAAPGSQLAQNEATATYGTVSVSDTVDVNWTQLGDTGLDATVSDSSNVEIPLGPGTYTYTESDVCSELSTSYTDGSYSGSATNTATIAWDGGSDSSTAITNYDCYLPTISKTVEDATYDQYRDWDITKAVTPLSQTGGPGDTLSWTWTVDVSETAVIFTDSYYTYGIIEITNPADIPLTVSVADLLDDTTVAIVDCGGGATSLTIPAGETGTCSWDASPTDQATSNTATATLPSGVEISDTEAVDFVVGEDLYTTAVVDDDQEPDFPLTLNAGEGPWQWTETQSHTCSTARADYTNGSYGDTLYNTATISPTGGTPESADAETTYTCEAGFVDVLKLTNGLENPTMNWTFQLKQGDDTLETLTTPPTLLEFQTALTVGETYTLCETGIPAGYSLMWVLDANGDGIYDPADGDQVLPYSMTGQTGDLLVIYDPEYGTVHTNDTYCVDFQAGEPGTVSFIVDNRAPGGGPRTPGYWKNWSSCSGGNQYETAQANGGSAEGWWTLDDLLPQTIGNANVGTCEEGVNLLDKSSFDGKKRANDAAYDLASALLAAQLNRAAGACIPTADQFAAAGITDYTSLDTLISDANALLTLVGFDGTGKYLDPKDKTGKRGDALYLAGLLDEYNNGYICAGEPTH